MTQDRVTQNQASPDHEVAIIGAGFSGIGAAYKLQEAGIDDFVVIERESEVGGTWWVNTYPGCRCDVPSHIYSYSFAPNPNWSQAYSPQPEILEYLKDCAERFGVYPRLRLNTELTGAEWDDDAALWRLTTSEGDTFTTRFVISGIGGLVEPALPEIEGVEDFEGEIMHSARWNHDFDLDGKRVAVVGTGASGVQIVPSIAKKVEHMDVYQRTPAWILPHPNRRMSKFEKALFRAFPPAQKAFRAAIYSFFEPGAIGFTIRPALLKGLEALARRHLKAQIPDDPELREKLTPDYRAGCKRITPTNAYYPALTRDNVDLVTDPIAKVTPTGIVTEDGAEREIDALIFATGFDVLHPPGLDRVRGRGGQNVYERWGEGEIPRAHLGTTMAGFPNFFTLLGPNTGTGHQSIVYMIESQLNYVIDAIGEMKERDLASIEVKQEAMDDYNEWLQKRSKRTVWVSGGCKSWYIDEQGQNATIWPSFTFEFRQKTRKIDLDEYMLRPAEPATTEPTRDDDVPVPA